MIQGVIEILTDSTAIRNIVGQNNATSKYKVYPVRAPQGEKEPYIVVFKTPGATPTQSKREVSTLDLNKFRVHGYVKNYNDRDAITEAIRATLDQMQSVTNNGIVFESIWYETDSDGFDDNANLYVAIVDFGCLVKR